MHYLFSSIANYAQDEIWAYTTKQWGKQQAEIYLRELHNAIANVVNKSHLWKRVRHANLKEIYYIRYKSHFIFFRSLPNGFLGVINIIHERMELPEELLFDGTKLETFQI